MMESVSIVNQEATAFQHENPESHITNQESSNSSTEYFSASASSVSCKEAKMNVGHTASSFQGMIDVATVDGISQNIHLAMRTHDFEPIVKEDESYLVGYGSFPLRDDDVNNSVNSVTEKLESLAVAAEDACAGVVKSCLNAETVLEEVADSSISRNGSTVTSCAFPVVQNANGRVGGAPKDLGNVKKSLVVAAEDPSSGAVWSCLNTETVLEKIADSPKSKNGGVERSCVFPVLQDAYGQVNGARKTDSILPCSLKIEVIDDTALICLPYHNAKAGIVKGMENRALAENVFRNVKEKSVNSYVKGFALIKFVNNRGKNVKEQTGGMKASQSSLQEKTAKVPSEKIIRISVRGKRTDEAKRVYSRKELEGHRYVDIINQRKLWKKVYTELENLVLCEYNDLTSSAHQNKFIRIGFDPQQRFVRNGVTPIVPGLVAARGRRNHFSTYMH